MNLAPIAIGIAVALAPVAADLLGVGGRPGLGSGERCVIAAGVMRAAFGFTPAGSRLRRAAFAGLIVPGRRP